MADFLEQQQPEPQTGPLLEVEIVERGFRQLAAQASPALQLGQAGLQQGQAGLGERLAALEQGQDALQEGLDALQEGQSKILQQIQAVYPSAPGEL
ncbi:hypothetical protein HOY82DRAFT_598880 [Tuber indicum]|nr:hypothetical protein HOY82DRAFT_598880 [Tuber indicum]